MFSVRSSRTLLLAAALLSACAAGDGGGGAPGSYSPSASNAFGAYLAGRFATSESDTRVAADSLLAVEGAAYGVRVNAVCPGVTNTPMAAFTFKDYVNPSDAPFVQQYALKRVAEPVEIANAILFLTSDESSYVTGSALAVDGGRCFH